MPIMLTVSNSLNLTAGKTETMMEYGDRFSRFGGGLQVMKRRVASWLAVWAAWGLFGGLAATFGAAEDGLSSAPAEYTDTLDPCYEEVTADAPRCPWYGRVEAIMLFRDSEGNIPLAAALGLPNPRAWRVEASVDGEWQRFADVPATVGPHDASLVFDQLLLPDGSLLVSDDRAGAIYRISYRK